MNDLAKTAVFVGAALVSCVAVLATRPAAMTFQDFDDQGQPFYPDFTDPLKAAALEVIDYDEASGSTLPFKVEVRDGVWSIPSHYDYPADGKDRLASTAAALIDLRKDVIQSDRPQDHEALGVLDPLDDTVITLKGRGQRAILRDASGTVLADFIFGKVDDSRQGFRYVRLPGKKRTYSVKVDLDISTRFADWIETNLLDVKNQDIVRLGVNDYSVDEGSGTAQVRDRIELLKDGNTWQLDGVPEGKVLDPAKVRTMASVLSRLTITGVRPKPPALTRDLKAREGLQIDLGTRLSLSSKGFFISNDGHLLSNEGEVLVGTQDGVGYTLRFGEVLFGEGLEVSAGSPSEDPAVGEDGESSGESSEDFGDPGETEGEKVENRYLFVTATFDESLLPPRPMPPDGYVPADQRDGSGEEKGLTDEGAGGEDATSDETEDSDEDAEPEDAESSEGDVEPDDSEVSEEDAAPGDAEDILRASEAYDEDLREWEEQVEQGKELAASLNDRFAAWYYVISGSDFGKIRVSREVLLKDKLGGSDGATEPRSDAGK